MKTNLLTDLRDTYAGPWPKTVLHLLLVALLGPLIAAMLFSEPLSLRTFAGSSLVALSAFALGVYLKRRYPRQSD